jgi:hypothetical protein
LRLAVRQRHDQVPSPAPFRGWDLGKEAEKVLAAGSRYRRRCHLQAESSWQAMVRMMDLHRFAWARPPPRHRRTPSIQEFAVFPLYHEGEL